MTASAPSWKFWHPIPFWKVIVVFVVVNLLVTFAFVAVRELAALDLPMSLSGGVGGGLSVLTVIALAHRERNKKG